jgi:dTDP-glucose 4,6-dehydratase
LTKISSKTFEAGIRKTLDWYLANPQWVANVQSNAYKDRVSKQYEGVKA